MRITRGITDWLARSLRARVIEKRPPDFVIGGQARDAFYCALNDRWSDGYLERWWLIPRNRVFNIYMHQVWRSDDDRALHDHPWFNLSLILARGYVETTIKAGGIEQRRRRLPGDLIFRSPWAAHRLELQPHFDPDLDVPLPPEPVLTLFITGPVVRDWGFHCPKVGWRHWKDFTNPADKGAVGRGCE